MSERRRIMHMCLDVCGYLENYRNKSMGGVFTKDDGTPADDHEAREFLYDQIRLGRRVIPMGDCGGFDYQKGCPGHEQEPPK